MIIMCVLGYKKCSYYSDTTGQSSKKKLSIFVVAIFVMFHIILKVQGKLRCVERGSK